MIYVAAFYALGRKYRFPVLGAVLLALLVQELLIRWLTFWGGASLLVVTAVSLWKDGAIVGLGMVWLRDFAERKIDVFPAATGKLRAAMAILLLALLAIGLLSAIVSPNRLAGVMAFRDYFEPLLVIVIVGAFYPSRGQLRGFVNSWLIVLALMALLGIVQTSVFSAEDYVRLGFGPPSGDIGIPEIGLSGGVRHRSPSTVTGPNELGMHLVLGLLFVGQLAVEAERRARWAYIGLFAIFGVGLVLTFSRSDLAAFLIGLSFIYWLDRHMSIRKIVNWSVLLLVVLGIMFVVAAQAGVLEHLLGTVTGLREQYHFADTSKAVAALLQRPAGVGMGLVGPRSGAFFPEEPAFHVEGSAFQIAFEMGVWGLALWGVFTAAAFVVVVRTRRRMQDRLEKVLAATALGGWLGLALVLIILPLMQSIVLMSWMWFLLGLALHAGQSESQTVGEIAA